MPREPRDFPSLLDAGLGMLRRDATAAYHRLAELLDGTPIRFAVDESDVVLYFEPARHALREAADGVRVRVGTNSDTILALLEDRLSLVDALRQGGLELSGPPDQIARFDDALTVFLAGAIRTEASAGLLDELRARVYKS